MDILINKKYLIRAEQYTKFWYGGYEDTDRYVFALPEWAGLPEGYTVYINACMRWGRDEKGNLFPYDYYDLDDNGTFRIPSDRNKEYVAVMTEGREEGKRYKRYKFTAKELYALYQNVTLTDAKTVAAKITIYSDGPVMPGLVLENKVVVGERKGCWFYSEELETKRRIGTKGVQILCGIEKEQIGDVQKLIEKYEDRNVQAEKALRDKRYDLTRMTSLSITMKTQEYISDELKALLDPIRQQVDDLKKTVELECQELSAKAETIFSELCEEVKHIGRGGVQTDEIRSNVSIPGNGERGHKGKKRQPCG